MRQESSSFVRIFYPKFDKEELIQNLKPKIKNLAMELPLSKVVLFGSYAQGRYTVASDVDILVVYRGKERRDSFAQVKKSLDIPLLEPHVYSEGEYDKLKESIERMIADGVVLFAQKDQIDHSSPSPIAQ
ncbi:MAG: nucleotidyltransferase domain-containing protein [Deltaproteobacteria bacterium]|nr:nucleotidyltransferase domain-containing protein [Deltaproteobacteria bacterium]